MYNFLYFTIGRGKAWKTSTTSLLYLSQFRKIDGKFLWSPGRNISSWVEMIQRIIILFYF